MTAETKDTTYNGWKNYETWSVALIIDNERGLYETRREMARGHWEATEDSTGRPEYFTRSQAARYNFADALKDLVEENLDGAGTSGDGDWNMLAQQLINAALSEVDWTEIADNWLNEEINENGAGGYETK